MTRFFVEGRELEQEKIVLTGENAAHAKVLRLKTDEEVLLCDGNGRECLCRVVKNDAQEFTVAVVIRRDSQAEPTIRASIYMALPKADKLEHVIQKATELGAYEIVTFPTARCISRPDEKSLGRKLERWQKIAASAAEQSGRGYIPHVYLLPNFGAALERARQADRAIVFYENEHATTLHHALTDSSHQSISLLSGPEGGFEEAEINEARKAGFSICTLGKRILRCETAPLCALSAVMYDAGEF